MKYTQDVINSNLNHVYPASCEIRYYNKKNIIVPIKFNHILSAFFVIAHQFMIIILSTHSLFYVNLFTGIYGLGTCLPGAIGWAGSAAHLMIYIEPCQQLRVLRTLIAAHISRQSRFDVRWPSNDRKGKPSGRSPAVSHKKNCRALRNPFQRNSLSELFLNCGSLCAVSDFSTAYSVFIRPCL